MRGEEDVGDQEGRAEIEVQGEYGCRRKGGKKRGKMRVRETVGVTAGAKGRRDGRRQGREGVEDLFLGRPRQ